MSEKSLALINANPIAYFLAEYENPNTDSTKFMAFSNIGVAFINAQKELKLAQIHEDGETERCQIRSFQIVPRPWFQEKSVMISLISHPEFVLDISWNSRKPGASLILYGRHGKDNQKFVFKSNGTIKCYHSGYILSAKSISVHEKVVQYSENDPRDKFEYDEKSRRIFVGGERKYSLGTPRVANRSELELQEVDSTDYNQWDLIPA